jgi:hypothetical protein
MIEHIYLMTLIYNRGVYCIRNNDLQVIEIKN